MDMLQETMNAVVSLGRVKLAMYRSDMTEHIEIKSCFPTIIPRIVKIINYIKNRTPLDFVCCRDFSKPSRFVIILLICDGSRIIGIISGDI